ncbi:unnamed protein product [Euphydryas editha]|uniref:Uncharacterized protein n=1 Tax=Euphydryas editha TaxID=104508 RepID=A0AAU9TSZ7_EUPED|nr:unnamed protein product [Euphydryas editha]
MKLTVTFLLLAAVSQAAKTNQKTQATERIEKTEKRELAEGNSGIEKRTPHLPGVSSTVATGGVEYADSKENLQDKSPTQDQLFNHKCPEVNKLNAPGRPDTPIEIVKNETHLM